MVEAKINPRCELCVHFLQSPEKSPSGEIVGQCRRYPRIASVDDDGPAWHYPLQFGRDVCGEFKEAGG